LLPTTATSEWALHLLDECAEPPDLWNGVVVQEHEILPFRRLSALVAGLGKPEILVVGDHLHIAAKAGQKRRCSVGGVVVHHDDFIGDALRDLRQGSSDTGSVNARLFQTGMMMEQ
jgi:hypothetical protein